jgi:KaiC/GvpD/RAD55 family RecA-like ATPase
MSNIPSEELATPIVKKHPFEIQLLDYILKEELPPIKPLIGELVYPEEQTILFGGSGLGKTLLAMQMADAISKGKNLNLGDVILINECDPIKVIYYDFELSPSQIQNRYKRLFDNPNLFYAQTKRGEAMETNPKEVFNQLKAGAEEVGAKCMIIDNISAISGDIEKGENAKLFMQPLWALAKDEKYTIIILAHTPKLEAFKPLTIDHLKGSSYLGQLADNVIAMGRVNTEGDKEVYIKQIKVRNSAESYGTSNVIHTKTVLIDSLLVHKAFGCTSEAELLTLATGELGRTPNRLFFVFAVLYYGNNEASRVLSELGVDGSSTGNLSHHTKMYKESDSKNFKQFQLIDDDELKRMVDHHNQSGKTLPLKKGHTIKGYDESGEIEL